MFRTESISKSNIHHLLSNSRRRHTIRYLQNNGGAVTVRELSEVVAAIETGESPPPRDIRETVYISLHQNHLPALDEQGVIEYDRQRKEVVPLPRTRDVRLYMEVVTRYGITWAEFYRYLGILGLLVTLAALIEVPLISRVAPLVWTSGFLALFAVSTVFQLWKERYSIVRRFFGFDDQ